MITTTHSNRRSAIEHNHRCEGCDRPVEPMEWSGDMAEPDPGRGGWCEHCYIITYCDACEAAAVGGVEDE